MLSLPARIGNICFKVADQTMFFENFEKIYIVLQPLYIQVKFTFQQFKLPKQISFSLSN